MHRSNEIVSSGGIYRSSIYKITILLLIVLTFANFQMQNQVSEIIKLTLDVNKTVDLESKDHSPETSDSNQRRHKPILLDSLNIWLPENVDVKWMHNCSLTPRQDNQEENVPLLSGTLKDWQDTGDWDQCLMIDASIDDSCNNSNSNNFTCRRSVMQLILEEVWSCFTETKWDAFLTFGTLLGAVRSKSIIHYTEDVDFGARWESDGQWNSNIERLRQCLKPRGYHIFRDGPTRVCITPHHPMAGLMATKIEYLTGPSPPYMDIYQVDDTNSRNTVEIQTERSSLLQSQVFPLSCYSIHGKQYPGLRDYHQHLQSEYGDNYLTPLQRGGY